MEGEAAGSGDLSIEDTVCVLSQLDVPDRVVSLMDSTTSLDGRQTETWDEVDASWRYHPDDGLDVLLALK